MREHLDKFQTVADCAVFPSLYEPFGIVALESFAARVPVVVSNAADFQRWCCTLKLALLLRQIIGILCRGILEVLKNPGYARWLVDNAYEDLERRFSWQKLAMETEWVYHRVVEERAEVDW